MNEADFDDTSVTGKRCLRVNDGRRGTVFLTCRPEHKGPVPSAARRRGAPKAAIIILFLSSSCSRAQRENHRTSTPLQCSS